MTDPGEVAARDQGAAVLRDTLGAHGVDTDDAVQLHAVVVTIDLALRTFRKQGPLGLVVLHEWARSLAA